MLVQPFKYYHQYGTKIEEMHFNGRSQIQIAVLLDIGIRNTKIVMALLGIAEDSRAEELIRKNIPEANWLGTIDHGLRAILGEPTGIVYV